ncbi:uncharacterized protein LTHEOB_5934 [Lasiodiplodia theobromae]|uniref:uncharacterized protein n=1 Tax=Lasiodiplodia theobromae TaxID=45133 RepID=UPI0015C34E65|nr:uncharacterized protein LTHEOB_5934 [Lasiodiplodia theobromae]KAF4544925.1 hypothetical protein LTHEOB_5934 [Lasiodiplodia theobromae]
MPTHYELRNRGQARAPARNNAQRKRAARVLSQAKMKEAALLKQIEARYAEAKACVASDSLYYFETHDELDMFMVQHAIHFRENPLDRFLYDNSREIRFRDSLARRSFVAQADDGELFVPGIPSHSTLPLFGQPVPQMHPRIRGDGQIVQTSAGGGVTTNSRPTATANTTAVMHHPPVSTTGTTTTTTTTTTAAAAAIANHPPAGADSTINASSPSGTSSESTPHTLSQQAESSDSEAAADSDSSSSVSNSRPSGIILRLTGLQSTHPRIQVLKRKAPEEDSASDAPATKRSRTVTSASPGHSVSTNTPDQTPEQESSEKATSSASSTSSEGSSSDDEGHKPQKSGNNPTGSKSAGGVVPSGSTRSLRKRKAVITYAEDDSSVSPPAKRPRAATREPTANATGATSHSTPSPSTTPIMPTTASTSTATNHTGGPPASSAAAANAAAPANQYRTRDDPVVGANGFQLIGKQHFFTVGYDQTEFLTQRYTVVENGVRSGVRTHTWEGNRGKTATDIDWNDKKTISRLNQWLAQWMRRSCGCGTMRPNVNKLRWTEEEYDWLRQYVADHPERPSRKQVTVDFNNHFRGRVFTYVDNGGEQVTMPAREDRQTEAIFTAMDRKKIGWRHLEN